MSEFGGRDWGGLRPILEEAKAIVEAGTEHSLIDCPIDGEPLQENASGAVNCPLGNYYAPQRPNLRDAGGTWLR